MSMTKSVAGNPWTLHTYMYVHTHALTREGCRWSGSSITFFTVITLYLVLYFTFACHATVITNVNKVKCLPINPKVFVGFSPWFFNPCWDWWDNSVTIVLIFNHRLCKIVLQHKVPSHPYDDFLHSDVYHKNYVVSIKFKINDHFSWWHTRAVWICVA